PTTSLDTLSLHDALPIFMHYASVTGSFAAINGLPANMIAKVNATELDLEIPVTAADLTPTAFTGPTAALDGQTITMNWTVKNQTDRKSTRLNSSHLVISY